ncbi:hypothetical protein V8E54_000593 [Elaphomyces granulatus]
MPNKTPFEIQDEIISLIRRADHRGNTPGKFLGSDALKEFLEDVGHDRRWLHPTLNNSDRIRSWIHKERLLINPLGQSYEAVVFEYLPKYHEHDLHPSVI